MESQNNYRWYLVFVGFLCMSLFYGIIINCQGQLIQPIILEQGYSRTVVSSVFALINGGMILSSPVLGILSDKYGPEKTMTGSSILVGLSMLLFATAKNLSVYYIGALFIGMAFVGVTLMMIPVLINLWFTKENRGTALSLAFMGSGVGGLLLNPVFAFMLTIFSWRMTYSIWALFFLLIFTPFIYVSTIFWPKRKGYSKEPQTEERASLENDIAPMGKSMSLVLITVAIASFLIGGVGTSVLMHGASHFTALGFTPQRAASTIGLALGILALGKVIVGRSCDKLGCRKTLMIFLTFAAGSTFSLYISPSFSYGWLSFAVFFGLGAATMTVCPPLIVRELFHEKRYSKDLGKVMASIGLGNMVVPLFAGVIYDKYLSYENYWLLATAILFIGMFLFLLAYRIKGKSEKINAMT